MVLRIAFAIAALAAAAPAAGEGQPALLHVSAEVRSSALLRLEARAASVAITEADIARGYVDVAAGALLTMDTGRVRPQIAAEVRPGAGPFSSVEVRTLYGSPASGGGGPALGLEPAGGLALVYRFNFSEKATAGSYQVPVTLSIGL